MWGGAARIGARRFCEVIRPGWGAGLERRRLGPRTSAAYARTTTIAVATAATATAPLAVHSHARTHARVRARARAPRALAVAMPVRFCSECNNVLYPQEDKEHYRRNNQRRLLYVCRNCPHREVAEDLSVPVHRHVVQHAANEKTTQVVDVTLDPTLPHTQQVTCQQCGTREAVYFQSPVGRNDEALVLVFTCVNCRHTWLSSDESQ